MHKIDLSQGKYAIVDEEDYQELSKQKWYYHRTGCAARTDNKNKKFIQMHRLIMGNPTNMTVDHINGNRLDNQRRNLRIATMRENAQNRRLRSDNRSGFKGVSFDTERGAWKVTVSRNTYIGHFTDKMEAARAYDSAAREQYGDFANTNF